MKKFLVFIIVAIAISACSPNIEKNESSDTATSDENIFKENNEENKEVKKEIEIPAKKEEKIEEVKPIENPDPNEKPPVEKKKEPPEIVEITIEDNKPASTDIPVEKPEGFIENPIYKITDGKEEKENYVNINYFGQNTPDEAKLRKYNVKTVIIDENGESLLFVPEIYGGIFKITHIEYDPDKQGFWLRDEVFSGVELQQDDAVLLKMNLPETSPNLIISYQKQGEFLVQTIPVYDGITGDMRADKGFKIIK